MPGYYPYSDPAFQDQVNLWLQQQRQNGQSPLEDIPLEQRKMGPKETADLYFAKQGLPNLFLPAQTEDQQTSNAETTSPATPNQFSDYDKLLAALSSNKRQIKIPEYKPEDFSDIRNQINVYQNKKQEMDWSPLLALTDAWTGSNFARSYQKPESQDDRELKALVLKEKLAEREAVDAYKSAMYKQQVESAINKQDNLEDSLKLRLGLEQIRNQNKQTNRADKSLFNNISKVNKDQKFMLMDLAQKLNPELGKDPQALEVSGNILGAKLMQYGDALEKQLKLPKGTGYFEALQKAQDPNKQKDLKQSLGFK